MNLDYIYQMLSIVLVAIAFLYFLDQLFGMKYSFFHIFKRTVFYWDFGPIDWLVAHLYYLFFLLLVVGHAFSLYGLLMQLGTADIHNKPAAFFISPFFNQIGMVGSVFFLLVRERVKIRRILKISH